MAQDHFEKALADEGLVGTPLESLARSIYTQESAGGKNTKTSNAGAVGGMQILPATFKSVLPGGDIKNPYDNAVGGLRYIKDLFNKTGDLNLTAVGYYGGPKGIEKAKQGIAVSDPRNPKAPTTLEYAKQVMSRTQNVPGQNVSRGTSPSIKDVIGELGQGYQAAYALMRNLDETKESPEEVARKEKEEESASAQHFAKVKEYLTATPVKSPFRTQQVAKAFADGGTVSEPSDQEQAPMYSGGVAMLSKGGEANKEEDEKFFQDLASNARQLPINLSYEVPKAQYVEGMGYVTPPPSVQGRVGTNFDALGGNVSMGASGVAMRTPDGKVITMPQMYDVGYSTETGPHKMDLKFQREIKAMPGRDKNYALSANYAYKFEKGGEAQKPAGKGVERQLAEVLGLDKAWDTAEEAPVKMGYNKDPGTLGDAARHMVLMRGIEQKYGPTAAKVMGYGHEIGNLFSEGNLFKPEARREMMRDYDMDIKNNALGIEISKQAGSDEAKYQKLLQDAMKKADYYRDTSRPVKRAEGSPETGEGLKGTAKEVLRSMQYAPYDIAGAPADIGNLALKGVDYVTGSKLASEKPVGGSDWLIQKSRELGIADEPTGSTTESLTRMGMGLVSPTAGPRAVAGVAKAVKGTAKAALEDLAMAGTGQGGSKLAQKIMEPGTAFAVRPKGGVYLGAQSVDQPPLVRSDFAIQEALNNVDTTTEQGAAIKQFFDKKVRGYIQNQRGTADDPVFKKVIEGQLPPSQFYIRPEKLEKYRQTGAAEDLKAVRDSYDADTNIVAFVEKNLAKEKGKGYTSPYLSQVEKGIKSKIAEQSPDNLTSLMTSVRPMSKESIAEYPTLYDYPGFQQMAKEGEAGKLLKMLNPSDLPPHVRQAIGQGEPVFADVTSLNGLKLNEVRDYLTTRSPNEIKNMGFADTLVKARQWHERLAEAAKNPEKLSRKELFAGTETVLPVSNKYSWVDVKTPDALSLEGNIMGHCVGRSNYCAAIEKGQSKILSLRDSKGVPHVTIEANATEPGVFNRIAQIKGTGNNSPEKYWPQVDSFLQDYSGKVTKPLVITETPSYVPPAWRNK